MATSNCLRCLPRPSATVPIPRRFAPPTISAVQVAPFSSTPGSMAAAAKKGGDANGRQGKRMNLAKFKKNARDTGKIKVPKPGERKAYRKRIVLSNDNAIPVPELEVMSAGKLLDKRSAGKVLSIPGDVVDQLRSIEAFKPTQTWGFFRSPSTLIRSESVDLFNRMHKSAGQKETLRLVITGDKISGKSTLLLQGIANAYLNKWIVFNIPEAQELTTACTEYAPIPGTEPVQYMQPNYALKMLQTIRKANEAVLSEQKTVLTHPDLSQHIPLGSSLLQLVSSAKEADHGWGVFQAFWRELHQPGRPPILFALDGLAHIMKISDYRSPAYELVHSHDLALVRLFTDYLSGKKSFPNGGAVLASTARNNAPRVASMDLALSQRIAEQRQRAGESDMEIPQADPYNRKYDPRVDAALATVQVIPVRSVTRPEARALMEYWAASGVLPYIVNEASVSERWTLGGNGVIGEMERASLLTARL